MIEGEVGRHNLLTRFLCLSWHCSGKLCESWELFSGQIKSSLVSGIDTLQIFSRHVGYTVAELLNHKTCNDDLSQMIVQKGWLKVYWAMGLKSGQTEDNKQVLSNFKDYFAVFFWTDSTATLYQLFSLALYPNLFPFPRISDYFE